ncbi:glycoside hydrolase family 92 protein [Saccharata proteae CBS 121410]|uniref:Glycoside hydrolase family 92 protein n=1 Tax=Saccharata proteae CBS 121410 TaxID=1314787 RepID=A0A9P4HLA0_9PEZI|nr:glycoside hydrolase family 92 protein [Saccharata proteae CBS 121410]
MLTFACVLALAPVFASAQNSSFDVLDYVNPLIGSDNGGNVFAGATLPYGMVKAVADVDGQNTGTLSNFELTALAGGFSTDGSNVIGFSPMHDSGTGGNPSLGNFPLFPQYCPDDDIDRCNYPKSVRATPYLNNTVVARPGYFALTLETGIHAEMTTTEHAALYHFNFPVANSSNGTALSPSLMVDLTDLWDSRQNASISIDPLTGRIKGNGTFLPSFGAGSYVMHFCYDFMGGPIKDSGMYVMNRSGTEPKDLFVTRGFNLFYLEAGGFVRFQRPENGTISARAGISFISADKACSNAETEIPTYDFSGIRKTAEDAWREKLSPISISPGDVSKDLQINFWSAVYRTMISPQNYTGENPYWESSDYFDSFYCIWDQFRSQLPFLTIIDPATLSGMIRSLLSTYQHLGWLPDCRMSLCKGWTQGGSNADVVLADAYVKNLAGIDWNLAYEAVLNDAENEPLEWSDEGRGGLMSWKSLHYIPELDYDYLGFGTNSRAISRTLEYAYDDFCLATLARGLGKNTTAKYLARAGNWRNLFKPDQTSYIDGVDTGYVGFFQPKFLNGTWGFQDPIACSPIGGFCSLTSNPSATFESSIWEYLFFVPQDLSSLIALLGGPEAFVNRLNYFHDSPLVDIGNEPVFLTVYEFHYAGRPGQSSRRKHFYVPASFNDSTTGLPGNDDSGAMGSFTAFAMLGLFPNPGQNVYLITAPFFPSISVTNPLTNNTATISTRNFDSAYKNIYIQSATLDGKNYTRNWIGHEFFTAGGVLELVLGEVEGGWGTGVGDLPPSMGDVVGAMDGMGEL